MRIAIIVNLEKNNAKEVTDKIIDLFAKENAEIIMDERCKNVFRQDKIKFLQNHDEIMKHSDAAVAVGGDGTIIHNAKHASKAGVPIIGVNIGRLGFVSGIETNEVNELSRILTGDYTIEKRMMLEITVHNDNNILKFNAINDAVISRGALSRIIDLSVSINNQTISHYRADGLLLSTPTGSTAYALSAGGPVIQPDMECILLTPVCPHSLFARPVLFSSNELITVEAIQADCDEIFLTIDGQTSIPILSHHKIEIKKADISLNMIKLKDKNFYSLLNEKLKERVD
ncbi:MAG: NAD(+)/NADH kinase [Bacillota bacterium]|nr:NAD(+)/NADH kinase [Bacillota bacterium]